MTGTDEKNRKTDRTPSRIRAQLVQKNVTETTTINVSRNGVFLKETSERAVNSLIRLRLFLPPDQKSIEVFGRVAWKGKAAGVDGVGVQFLNVDSKDRAKWLEFIGEIEALTGSHKVSESESGLPSVGPADQKSERRAFTRTTASFMVRFRTRERLEHFIANNVSQGGMFLRTPVLRPIGERVQVVIIHPETDRDFEIEAEVAHTNEHGTPENPKGMGLKFHELRPETKTALDAFIKGTKS